MHCSIQKASLQLRCFARGRVQVFFSLQIAVTFKGKTGYMRDGSCLWEFSILTLSVRPNILTPTKVEMEITPIAPGASLGRRLYQLLGPFHDPTLIVTSPILILLSCFRGPDQDNRHRSETPIGLHST